MRLFTRLLYQVQRFLCLLQPRNHRSESLAWYSQSFGTAPPSQVHLSASTVSVHHLSEHKTTSVSRYLGLLPLVENHSIFTSHLDSQDFTSIEASPFHFRLLALPILLTNSIKFYLSISHPRSFNGHHFHPLKVNHITPSSIQHAADPSPPPIPRSKLQYLQGVLPVLGLNAWTKSPRHLSETQFDFRSSVNPLGRSLHAKLFISTMSPSLTSFLRPAIHQQSF